MSPPKDPRKLAAEHVPWARRIALALVTIYGVLHECDDLVATALEALTRAARAFDSTRGVPFQGFAYKRVAGEVLDAIGKEIRRISFLRGAVEASAGVGAGAPSETIDELMLAIDRVAAAAMEEADLCFLADDMRADGEAQLLRREAHEALHGAIGKLDDDDRRLVDLRWFQGLEWKEVGRQLGLPERTAQHRGLRIRLSLREEIER